MVKFEFVLEDGDAENFLDMLQTNIREARMSLLESTAEEDEVMQAWWKDHIVYLNGIIDAVTKGNSRV